MCWESKFSYELVEISGNKYVLLLSTTLHRNKCALFELNVIRLLGWSRRHKYYANAPHRYVIRRLLILYFGNNRIRFNIIFPSIPKLPNCYLYFSYEPTIILAYHTCLVPHLCVSRLALLEPDRWGFLEICKIPCKREICKMPCKRASLSIGARLGEPGGGSFAGTFERNE
jgi:hypothetical protein